jgi:hypothetical protein
MTPIQPQLFTRCGGFHQVLGLLDACNDPEALCEDEIFAHSFPGTSLQDRVSAYSKQLRDIGSSKNVTSKNVSDADVIARAVMRSPSVETKTLLYQLHASLKCLLMGEEDEGLDWLLGGSSKETRGGFLNVSSLRAFLNRDPQGVSSSRLITGIETLLSAIAYRKFCSEHQHRTLPIRPQTPAQQAVFNLFSTLQCHFPELETAYSDRRYCIKATYSSSESYPPKFCDYNPMMEFFTPTREEISDASDAEELPPFKKLLPAIVFRKQKKTEDSLTWVGAAHAGNIPIRCAISASVCICLETALWLLQKVPETTVTASQHKIIELLTGALFIPTYFRADYHSIAETAAGSLFYKKYTQKNHSEVPFIGPKDALQVGLQWMAQAIDPQYQEAINNRVTAILKETLYVDYQFDKTTQMRLGRIERFEE